MSDYSSNFPTQSPTFAFDAKAGKLDSRISFSRADSTPSAVHYWSNEKHLSSLNLLTNSEDFSAWTKTAYVSVSANAAASPNGTTTADKITVSSTSNYPWTYQASGVTSGASDTVVFSVYLKMDGWRYVLLSPSNQSGEGVWFDLQSGAVGTESAGSTGTITAIGSAGWYRCSVERTGSMTVQALVALVDADNSQTGTAGGTNGVLVWGGQLTDQFSGVTAYNSTATQIHREYSSTLKSVSTSGQPRFEYDPADGQSEGLLIEAQATNLQRYGSDFASWLSKANLVTHSNQAIAPNGELEADSLVPTTGNTYHYIYDGQASVASGTTYTFSVYLKSAGYRYAQLLALSSLQSSGHVTYDLEAGTLSASGAHTGTIESVGNGWFRASATVTATSTTTSGFLIAGADSLSNGRNPQTNGNAYDGWLCWGAQLEANSSASSLVNSGTSSSGVTRAADSCSVADFGFTGGPVSVIATANMTSPATDTSQKSVFELGDGTSDNRIWVYNNFGKADSLYVRADGVTGMFEAGTITTAADFAVAVRVDTNNAGRSTNGGSVTSDTSVVMPSGLDTLYIGRSKSTSVNALNGHIKRLSLYSVALSDVELQSLTSNP